MPERALKPILQLQSPCSRPLYSSGCLFLSSEATSSWKISTPELKLFLILQESRHPDQAQRNGPCLHLVEDPRSWEALGLELVTTGLTFMHRTLLSHLGSHCYCTINQHTMEPALLLRVAATPGFRLAAD